MKSDIAKWDTKDIADVKDQRKSSEVEEDEDDDDGVSLAESLEVTSIKDLAEAMQDVVDVLNEKEESGPKEEVTNQETDTHEDKLGEGIEDDAISEVEMESIHKMADEDPVETVSASFVAEEKNEENERTNENQTQTNDTSLDVAFKEKIINDTIADEEEPIKSTVDPNVEALGEEELVENVDVSDASIEEEPVEVLATNKIDEDQTGETFSETTTKEESVEPTVLNIEEIPLKPTIKMEPVETVSGESGDKEPVKLPATLTNETDHNHTKTTDLSSGTMIKEESVVSNVEELKPPATKSMDEDRSITSEILPGNQIKMESVDVSLVNDDDDADEEETQLLAQEIATTESSLDSHDRFGDEMKAEVLKEDIKEVKEDQVKETVIKGIISDPHSVDSNSDAVHVQFLIEDDVDQSDDKNNNNDRKRQPVTRDQAKHGATTKEIHDEEDELHDENEKGIKGLFYSVK